MPKKKSKRTKYQKFEDVCYSYAFGLTPCYAYYEKRGRAIYASTPQKSIEDLLAIDNPTFDVRVNRYDLRNFKLPTYKELTFWDIDPGERVLVLIEDDFSL